MYFPPSGCDISNLTSSWLWSTTYSTFWSDLEWPGQQGHGPPNHGQMIATADYEADPARHRRAKLFSTSRFDNLPFVPVPQGSFQFWNRFAKISIWQKISLENSKNPRIHWVSFKFAASTRRAMHALSPGPSYNFPSGRFHGTTVYGKDECGTEEKARPAPDG